MTHRGEGRGGVVGSVSSVTRVSRKMSVFDPASFQTSLAVQPVGHRVRYHEVALPNPGRRSRFSFSLCSFSICAREIHDVNVRRVLSNFRKNSIHAETEIPGPSTDRRFNPSAFRDNRQYGDIILRGKVSIGYLWRGTVIMGVLKINELNLENVVRFSRFIHVFVFCKWPHDSRSLVPEPFFRNTS